MKNIKTMLAVFSSAVLVFAAGCSEKRESAGNNIVYYNDSNTYSQAAEGVENSSGNVIKEENLIENIPTTPIEIGNNAELSGLDFKFTNVYNAGTLKANENYNYDKQVLVVVCEIKNNLSEDIDINAFDMKIRFIDGEETYIMTDVEAMLQAGEKIRDIESLNTTLEPGQSVKGYAALAVYSRWDSLTVYFSPENIDVNDALAFDITKDMVENL